MQGVSSSFIPAGRKRRRCEICGLNPQVAAVIRKLRAGQVVKLRGYLVNAAKPDGFRWPTSLSRTDTGKGACELFYVEAVQAEDHAL